VTAPASRIPSHRLHRLHLRGRERREIRRRGRGQQEDQRRGASVVRLLDPDARVERVMPLADVVAESIRAPRFFGQLLAVFAAIGVTLAAIGLFGVVAHAVTRRTKEIGIRLALGARRATVLSLVVQRSALLTIAGISLGLIGAYGGSRYLQSMLFGIGVLDALTFALTAVGFFVVATVAALVPALRATRIDPLLSPRHE
jgi:predicted lysophospholipase L1 biosynthesis ABC-type transport system permease subunit